MIPGEHERAAVSMPWTIISICQQVVDEGQESPKVSEVDIWEMAPRLGSCSVARPDEGKWQGMCRFERLLPGRIVQGRGCLRSSLDFAMRMPSQRSGDGGGEQGKVNVEDGGRPQLGSGKLGVTGID